MRADEAMALKDIRGTWLIDDVDYINQLRYERLMAKSRELRQYGIRCCYVYKTNAGQYLYERCFRIAEALEARARRIKEGM